MDGGSLSLQLATGVESQEGHSETGQRKGSVRRERSHRIVFPGLDDFVDFFFCVCFVF